MGRPPQSRLYFGDFCVYAPSYGSDEFTESLFVQADRVIDTVSWLESHPELADISNSLSSEVTGQTFTRYRYKVSASHAIERLELRGYTLESSAAAFKSGMDSLVNYLSNVGIWMSLQSQRGDLGLDMMEEFQTASLKAGAQQEFHFDFSFERWLEQVRILIDRHIDAYKIPVDITPLVEPQLYFMLQEHASRTSIFGFPCDDLNFVFRALLEVCRDSLVSLDYSDLIEWEEVDPDSHLIPSRAHFVILTEGSSDVEILRQTLDARFPHLSSYYGFMKFEVGGVSRVSGSANELVKLVKAIVGAGFSDRIIAIFDNDAAAKDALRSLKGVRLPSNIRIMQLPELDLAREYPTIGPQSLEKPALVDVNGSAGSIELYLGRDILTNGYGELTPVRWSSYINGVSLYQGEVDNKDRLQSRYLEQLRTDWESHDWAGMDAVWRSIFQAFSDSTPDIKPQRRRAAPPAFYFGPRRTI